MNGKIVFEGKSKQGKAFLIRYPQNDDAELMLSYINRISEEQTFILYQGEQKTLEEEQTFLKKQLKDISEHKTVMLLAFKEEDLIGISEIRMSRGAATHEGGLGISLAKDYRGEGIGKALMQAILTEAELRLPELRLVTLGVFENNDPAIGLYKSFGFVEFGRLPEGLQRKGIYSDHVYMYKKSSKCIRSGFIKP